MLKIPTRKPPESKTAPPEDAKILEDMVLSPVTKRQDLLPIVEIKTGIKKTVADLDMELFQKAYDNAFNLKLTADEDKALRAEFPDACFMRGASGKDDLIYIGHQHLRERLNKVLGAGSWRLMEVRSWTEDFLAGRPPSPAVRIYAETALIIRGCYVGKAIGDGNYFKNNAATNFGDAYESAKSAALRRCCKDFGIGLQAWDKDWCEGWKRRYPGFERPVKQ